MGTIAEKLSYLADTKDLFKDRLNSLGAEITSSTTFRNYLNWLDTFYEKVSDKTDLSQNGVVGRTSQESTTGKNKLLITASSSRTDANVTGTYNETDGSFTISGTASSSKNAQITSTIPLELEAGTYTFSIDHVLTKQIYLHFNLNGGGTQNIVIPAGQTEGTGTFEVATTGYNIRYGVDNGSVYNEKIFMQLEDGPSATSWEKFTYGASPNPSYEQPINNLSGDVAYKVSGKNLFNENYYSDKTKYEKYGNYYAFAELPNYFKTKFYANVFLKGISNNLTICFNDSKSIPSNDKKILNAGVINSNVEFDFTNAEKVYIGIGNGSGVDLYTDIDNIFNNYNIMCTLSLNVPYEPYIEPQTFNIPLGDIELCKIDTYEDRIYQLNNKWYLEKQIGKVAITTNDYITHYSIWHWIGFNKPNNSIMRNNFNNYELYMEKAYYANDRTKIYSYNTSLASEQMGIICYEDDDATTLKQKLDGSLMYYPLATPTTTEITQENYPSLYNALKQIQDYLTAYKINKEFILGYSNPTIEY